MGLLWVSYASVTFATQQVTPKTTVLVHGDSLSAAYGLPEEAGWVALLQAKRPDLSVQNSSLSGETTSGGKQRLPALMQIHRPQILVLELGANDALRGQNLTATEANLQTMIELCQSAEWGCNTLLLGVRLPTNYGPAYDALFQQMYQRLAQRNHLAFEPFFIEDAALTPGWMQDDGLHPAAEAQPLILERVWRRLAPLVPASRQEMRD